MRRNRKQLNAISRAYTLRKFQESERLLKDLNLLETFKYSKYKSYNTFIRFNQELIKSKCNELNINYFDYKL